jgi:hypothetical protein
MRKIGIIASIVVAVVAISAISYTAIIGSKTAVGQEGMAVDVVRDTVQVILDHKRINANDFMHLYDSAPYHIMNGHVALKMPCDADGNPMPRVKVMAGNADMGMFEELNLNLLEKVSTKGKMCIWHMDLESTHEKDKALGKITDVIIMNDSNTPIRFPAGSSVVVGVNEIMKGEEHKEEEGH